MLYVCMYIVGIYKLYNHRFYKENKLRYKNLFLLFEMFSLSRFFLFLCFFFVLISFFFFAVYDSVQGVGEGGGMGRLRWVFAGYKLRLCRSKLMRGTCVECLSLYISLRSNKKKYRIVFL